MTVFLRFFRRAYLALARFTAMPGDGLNLRSVGLSVLFSSGLTANSVSNPPTAPTAAMTPNKTQWLVFMRRETVSGPKDTPMKRMLL